MENNFSTHIFAKKTKWTKFSANMRRATKTWHLATFCMYKFFRKIRLVHISSLFTILYDVRPWGWIAFKINVWSCWMACNNVYHLYWGSRHIVMRSLYTHVFSVQKLMKAASQGSEQCQLLWIFAAARKALYAISFLPQVVAQRKAVCEHNLPCFIRATILASNVFPPL